MWDTQGPRREEQTSQGAKLRNRPVASSREVKEELLKFTLQAKIPRVNPKSSRPGVHRRSGKLLSFFLVEAETDS